MVVFLQLKIIYKSKFTKQSVIKKEKQVIKKIRLEIDN